MCLTPGPVHQTVSTIYAVRILFRFLLCTHLISGADFFWFHEPTFCIIEILFSFGKRWQGILFCLLFFSICLLWAQLNWGFIPTEKRTALWCGPVNSVNLSLLTRAEILELKLLALYLCLFACWRPWSSERTLPSCNMCFLSLPLMVLPNSIIKSLELKELHYNWLRGKGAPWISGIFLKSPKLKSF